MPSDTPLPLSPCALPTLPAMHRRTAVLTLAGSCLLPSAKALHAAQGEAPAPSQAEAEADIRASRQTFAAPTDASPEPPAWASVGRELFIAIEGDGHLSLLDGTHLAVLARQRIRPQLLPAVHLAPDRRHAFLATRDGWVVKYDLWRSRQAAQVRIGQRLQGLLLSGDGRWLLAASDAPGAVALFDAELHLARLHRAATLDGRQTSRIAALQHAPLRRSFIVALRDIPQLWEISYDPGAAPIYDGLVHDYRMGEAIARPGHLGVRRTPLGAPLRQLRLDPAQRYLLGAGPDYAGMAMLHLDARVQISLTPEPGQPSPATGAFFTWQGRSALASANRHAALLHVFDLEKRQSIRSLVPAAAGTFVASHVAAAHLWTDAALPGTLALYDKDTLEPTGALDIPGGTPTQTLFSRDGRHALVSVQGQEAKTGALLIHDTQSLREIRRLPMRAPCSVQPVPFVNPVLALDH